MACVSNKARDRQRQVSTCLLEVHDKLRGRDSIRNGVGYPNEAII